ncbi:MAG: sugar ABC transporter substrate-binding protein [Anaerolineales bacterium]|nr:sugar ABC transporter substrate-binding protein [Anaerolineales bacterium]
MPWIPVLDLDTRVVCPLTVSLTNTSVWLLVSLVVLPGCSKKCPQKIQIGVSLTTQRDERWVRDAQRMREVAQEMDVELRMQISDNDAFKQMSQCENLFAQRVDILVLAPHDATSAASIVEKAHRLGIKVISYDRLVLDSEVDLYISFDNMKVGELQGQFLVNRVPRGKYVVFGGAPTDNNAKLFKQGAMNVIQPLVAKGDIQIIMDQWIQDWQPTMAMNMMQNALTANNNQIDAVLAPNDNTAGGIIQALTQVGLAGKIPVTGQDAELTGAQRIVKGTQSMTVFKDTRALAKEGIEAAVKMVKGEDPGATSKVNNNKIDVPAILLPPLVVDKDNLDAVLVQSGYLKKEDLYK